MGHAGDEHDDEPLGEDPEATRGSPPSPLDRVWVHPAELPAVPRRTRARARLAGAIVPVAAGAVGALLTVALLAAVGAFDEGDSRAPAEGADRAQPAEGRRLLDGVTAGMVLVTVHDATGVRRTSGVCVRHSGEVLTSGRVLDGATSVEVTTADGQTFDAQVVGRDDATDLVLLTVDRPLSAVPLSSTATTPGDAVWLVAAPPAGPGPAWIADAIVSSTDATVAEEGGPMFGGLLEADAPSTGASAGGAVVDAQGDVAGIVLAPAAGRSTTYAVPITVALAVAQDLRDDGRVAHGALEVLGTDTERGAMVTGVAAGSTAERAGIAVGDVVVAIDDRPVVAMGELTATVRRYAPGTEVTLSVWRGDRPEQLVVELASTLVETTT